MQNIVIMKDLAMVSGRVEQAAGGAVNNRLATALLKLLLCFFEITGFS